MKARFLNLINLALFALQTACTVGISGVSGNLNSDTLKVSVKQASYQADPTSEFPIDFEIESAIDMNLSGSTP